VGRRWGEGVVGTELGKRLPGRSGGMYHSFPVQRLPRLFE